MIISSYFALMDDAAPHVRAEAVGVLANAYLSSTLGGEDPREVDAALSMVLDDPSPKVRRALAVAFAEQREVPRHIVLSLAADEQEVSALLIARSPLLTDADLIELARSAEGLALVAVTLRLHVSSAVCSALVARGLPTIQLALVRNREAEISDDDLLAIAQMPECSATIREAILARHAVPPSVRHALMVRVARSLGGFASEGGFMPEGRNARMIDDTIRDATISIAARQPAQMQRFVAYLRQGAFLTPALILRSVLGGHLGFLAHALAELSELDISRVTGLIKGRSTAALSALFRRADLPEFLENALIDAVRAAQNQHEGLAADGLSLAVIQAAQSACMRQKDAESTRLLALLRRFEAEAARAQSRKIAGDLLTRVRKERLELSAAEPAMPMLEMLLDAADNNTATDHTADDDPARMETALSASEIGVDLSSGAADGPEQFAAIASDETGAIRSSSKLKSLIAEWRRESEQRYPQLEITPPTPANSESFADWEIRGAA